MFSTMRKIQQNFSIGGHSMCGYETHPTLISEFFFERQYFFGIKLETLKTLVVLKYFRFRVYMYNSIDQIQ